MNNRTRVWLTGIALALGCGAQAPAASFSVALAIASQSPPQARPGAPAAYSVNVTASGQKSLTVNLTVSGLPAGVTAFFRPNSVSFIPGGHRSSKSLLTLTTPSTTPGGTYPFTVTGTYQHGTTRRVTATGTLVVASTAPTITALDPQPNGGTSLTCAGVPNQGFFIQATPDVRSPTWITISTNQTDAAGLSTFVEAGGANNSRRFYRTSLVP